MVDYLVCLVLINIQSRLRCDRAVPACGNCVNRGEITSCCYVARKNEVRAKPQESQELSSTATQSRIDHLEQLVLTLLKTQQRTRDSPDSISSNGEVEDSSIYDRIATDSGILKTGEQRVTGRLAKASNASQAAGNHKHSTVVDEAHWTLLLNEVGMAICSFQCILNRFSDWRSSVAFVRPGEEV